MKSVILAALFVLIGTVSAFNRTKDEQRRRALQNPDLFQGDILGIDPDDRNVIPNARRRWKNAIVPVSFAPKISEYIPLISSAMQEYHKHTCVRFVHKTKERSFLRIFSGEGCSSHVGRVGGMQSLSLNREGCMDKGTILHELGHALGLFHEQNRSDRDKYVRISYCNIQEGEQKQFSKLPPSDNILMYRFDYESIMLYGNYAFSKHPESVTMEAVDGTPLLEPRERGKLSPSDIYKINTMYGCTYDFIDEDHTIHTIL